MKHNLKTWIEPFEAVHAGTKTHEYRRDDRGFAVGDTLLLLEWDHETGRFTGKALHVLVTYVSRDGFGIPPGFCVMSIAKVSTPIAT